MPTQNVQEAGAPTSTGHHMDRLILPPSVEHGRTVVREWCREFSCPWWRYRHEHDVLSIHAGIYTSLMGAGWAR